MQKSIFILLLVFFNIVSGQIRYFDEFDKEITEQEFNKRRKSRLLKVFNDSTKQAKIIDSREPSGQINTSDIIDNLNLKLKVNINKEKPLVIVYHPGKDQCNSGGVATPESSYNWHKIMENGDRKTPDFQVIYLYKKNENIKTINKLKWYKDPESIIENTFFHYHYPCSSYVVLYKDKYISRFAEFSIENVWKNIKKIAN